MQCLPECAGPVEGIDERDGLQVGLQARLYARGQGRARCVLIHVRLEVAKDPLAAPVRFDARLDQGVDVRAEGLRLSRRSMTRFDGEASLGPAEALDEPSAYLVLEREEEPPRLDQLEIEEGLTLLALLFLDALDHARVVATADDPGVHELDAEALAGQVRFGKDGAAVPQQEGLLHAVPEDLYGPVESRAVKIQHEGRKRGLLQVPLLGK